MKVNWEYYVLNQLENFFEWFLVQEILIQVLILVGLFTIIALVGVLLYYIIKGIAYLVYYLLKGIYLIIRGVALGIYKIFQGLYYMISSKEKPINQENESESNQEQEQVAVSQEQVIRSKNPMNNAESRKQVKYINADALFCTECGNRFSVNMKDHLDSTGIGFCTNCGKEFKVQRIESYV